MGLEDSGKIYFSIAEMAQELGLKASTLRFWEKEFPQLDPKKNARGVRYYTRQDLELLRVIHHLVRVKGYSLDAARVHLVTKPKLKTTLNVVERLEFLKSEIVKLREMIPRK